MKQYLSHTAGSHAEPNYTALFTELLTANPADMDWQRHCSVKLWTLQEVAHIDYSGVTNSTVFSWKFWHYWWLETIIKNLAFELLINKLLWMNHAWTSEIQASTAARVWSSDKVPSSLIWRKIELGIIGTSMDRGKMIDDNMINSETYKVNI